MSAVAENPVHPTADTVYNLLKDDNPHLSLGTVYRNLNLLVETGSLIKLNVPSGCDRFDATTAPHFHLICENCGEVFDAKQDMFKKIEKLISVETGFMPSDESLVINGMCTKCQQSVNVNA